MTPRDILLSLFASLLGHGWSKDAVARQNGLEVVDLQVPRWFDHSLHVEKSITGPVIASSATCGVSFNLGDLRQRNELEP